MPQMPQAISSNPLDDAYDRIVNFADRFGEPHTTLAMHAALPLGLTPELVHLIRTNFVRRAPAIAEADLLLSPLCREVGGEFYEMYPEVRELLLAELSEDEELGKERIEELSEFLLAYATRNFSPTARAELRNFLVAQQWMALAQLRPAEAAQLLASALGGRLTAHNPAGSVRLAQLARTLGPQLIGQDNVLTYAAGIERFARGDGSRAAELFEVLGAKQQSPVIKSIPLPALPDLAKLWPEVAEDIGASEAGTAPPSPPLPAHVTLRYKLVIEDAPVTQAAWSPDGKSLALATSEAAIHLWDAETQVIRFEALSLPAEIRCFAWAPDSLSIAAGLSNHQFWIGHVSLSDTPNLRGVKAPVNDIGWSPDQRWLAAALEDGSIQVRDTRIWREGPSLQQFDRFPRCLSWAPSGASYLVAGYTNGYVIAWDTNSWSRRRTYHGHAALVNSVVVSPNSAFFASGSDDGTVRIWRIDESAEEYSITLKDHDGPVTRVCFSPDGSLLASRSHDGTIRLWRSPDWKCVAMIDASAAVSDQPPLPSSVLAFHPEENLLAACVESDATISVLELDVPSLLQAPAVSETAKPERPSVYFSYGFDLESNMHVAEELRSVLSQQYDVTRSDQPTGTSLPETTISALSRSDVFVVLLSAEAVRSPFLREEIEIAQAQHQRKQRPIIVPVRLASHEPLPYSLSRHLEGLLFLHWEGPKDTLRLISELSKRIEEVLRQPVQDAPAPPPPVAGGGPLSLGSAFYIERKTDREAQSEIEKTGRTIIVHGPRESGKSSLLARVVEAAYQAGMRVATVEIQTFEEDALGSSEKFFRQFCARLESQVGQKTRVDDFWGEERKRSRAPAQSAAQKCTDFVESVLAEATSPLALAVDGADRLDGTSVQKEFIEMLQRWHERPQFQERCSLVITTTVSPQHSIQTPFNDLYKVGGWIGLEDFSLAEVSDLNHRYGTPLDEHVLARMFDLLGGHPYLTHLTISLMAGRRLPVEELFRRAPDYQNGPFSEHLLRLHRFFFQRRRDGNPVMSFAEVIEGRPVREPRLLVQLESEGLVRMRQGKPEPRCQLYIEFFNRHVAT